MKVNRKAGKDSGWDQLHCEIEGDTAVVSFGDVRSPHETDAGEIADKLEQLVKRHAIKTLVFDLENVAMLPSDVFGLLILYRNRGYDVAIRRPSREVTDVLAVTKIDSIIRVER
ncbi:STAS domain-containing protein [Stratiformator vulcanicus]|nr:STAS domain-containing protein [Stratiformator vulcanicus]